MRKLTFILLLLLLSNSAFALPDFQQTRNSSYNWTYSLNNVSNIYALFVNVTNDVCVVGGNCLSSVSGGSGDNSSWNESYANGLYLNSTSTLNGSNVLAGTINLAYLDTDVVTAAELTAGLAAQDECSEITNCVINALTNNTVAYFSSVLSDDWSNVSITESQISDLSFHTNLSESDVEGYIFDADNTGTLNTSGNIFATNINATNDICIFGGNCLSEAGSGSGDITAVTTTAAGGLQGGVTSGDANISINTTYLSSAITALDTNANTICSGTTTYLDGEGNCDDISGVYLTSYTETDPIWNGNASRVTALETSNTTIFTLANAINTTANIEGLGFVTGAHTTDTNASTACSGTTTYLDGEGNCDDISSVYQAAGTYAGTGTCAAGTVVQNTTTGGVQCVTDADTTYSAGGTLLDLTGTTFSINEGTLTDTYLCTYSSSGTQLVCNTDPATYSPVAGSTSIVTVGTVTTGTWQGTSIADAYVDNAITVSGGTIGSNSISGTLTTTATLTVGDGGDAVNFDTSTWDVTAGNFSGVVETGYANGARIYDNSTCIVIEGPTSRLEVC